MINRREFIFNALAIMPVLCFFGCAEKKKSSPENIFEEMLECDAVAFARILDAEYISEKFLLNDGFKLLCYEENIRIQYGFFRYFDDDLSPNKLVLSKRAFIQISDTDALSVKFRDVYIWKTKTLKTGDANYWKLDYEDVYNSVHPENNNYTSISFEDMQAELEQIGNVGFIANLMSGISERFIELFLSNMESSFCSQDLGSFSDCRK
jgi:hypothetical protein